ncbi:DNA/RNA non-specific endonuclease [Lactobacillus sp. DCY120]|uniref:DNA/RNA non-specific endonuclease n=1 Tax=Bombilactobacillus apium TaxID=2675299 RepID=A0A850R487_9LACO|nr:DNA/RNA non-specific endonuclease [Bombilactobacillus apium]NVY96791.1 DNA/RNA non-specific endonuclease [Bombilactobacillus apium]
MPQRRKKKAFPTSIWSRWAVIIILVIVGWGIGQQKTSKTPTQLTRTEVAQPASATSQQAKQSLANWTYQGHQVVAVNQNRPTFTAQDLSLQQGSWAQYGNLDNLNRATAAEALLGVDLMPTAPRERLYIRPTAYHNKKIRQGSRQFWLYNRCHLLGFQLTGQNNNPKNLMTGTRALNDPAMAYYENQMAHYLKQTHHHIRYEVEPIFRNQELLARGVHLQGQSVEDEDIKFNIYIFNVQAGVTLNYRNGTSIIQHN